MRESSKTSGKEDGFTLMEAVLVVMIGGVLVPSILLGLGMSVKGSSEMVAIHRNATIADFALKEKMEEKIGLPYSDSGLDPVSNQSFDIDEPAFSGVYTISYVDEDLNSSVDDVGYKKITVRVSTPGEGSYELKAVVTSWK